MRKLTPLAAALLLFAGAAQATTINGLSATPNSATLTGGPVTVNLHASLGHADNTPGSCGVQLDYGDGSAPEQFLVQITNSTADSSHAYATAGNFMVSMKGVSMLNPAGNMRPACTGSAGAAVSIQPPVAGATITGGSAAPNPAKPGENVTHTFKASHDPAIPGACGARLTYSDGTPAEDFLIKAADNTITRSHAYAAEGDYEAKLTGVPVGPRPACKGMASLGVKVKKGAASSNGSSGIGKFGDVANSKVILQAAEQLAEGYKLINLTPEYGAFHDGQTLRFYVLRHDAGSCGGVKVSLNGKVRVDKNVTFPYTLEINPGSSLYPSKGGMYDISVEGMSSQCTGKLTKSFGFNNQINRITGLSLSGFSPWSNGKKKVHIEGYGLCQIRLAFYTGGLGANKNTTYIPLQFVTGKLPMDVEVKEVSYHPFTDGTYLAEVYSMKGYGNGECYVDDPKNTAQSHVLIKEVEFKVTGNPEHTGQNSGNNNNSGNGNSTGGSTGGSTGQGSQTPAATGHIASLQVPDGSFAEDEAQKLQVSGTGGCLMDLRIFNTTYGGNFDQTWPAGPLDLSKSPILYNGTNFATLAEGSYKATVTGKNGCSGNATIDFKVTPKTSIKKIMGKPTITFDNMPPSGVFKKSKDSNIWIRIAVPQSIKDEQYASCCEVEYNYQNSYGAWEVLPPGPTQDASWANAVKLPSAEAVKSVSYFSDGTHWRMRARGYKYKAEFEWSDWVEFQVDQN